METWSRWYPELAPVPVDVPPDGPVRPSLPGKTAAFFSGGVDSSYTVVHAARSQDVKIDDLIFLHGFDIPIGNDPAFERAFDNARTVADALGVRLIPLATNLRETRFQEANWSGLSFGSLLAGAGLTLGRRYRRILISSGTRQLNSTTLWSRMGTWASSDSLMLARSTLASRSSGK